MTESTTSPSTLKIRIRIDGAGPPLEAPPAAAATLDLRRVSIALGVLVLVLAAAIFGIRALLKNDSSPQVQARSTEAVPSPAEAIPTPPPAPVSTPIPASLPSSNRVVRAVLTDTVRKHQPVQALAGNLPVSDVTKRFYFFTDVQNVVSRRFIHRWEYRGKPVAQIPFSTNGKNWAGSSSKQIPTHMQGVWRVVLLDERSAELKSVTFTYGKE